MRFFFPSVCMTVNVNLRPKSLLPWMSKNREALGHVRMSFPIVAVPNSEILREIYTRSSSSNYFHEVFQVLVFFFKEKEKRKFVEIDFD